MESTDNNVTISDKIQLESARGFWQGGFAEFKCYIINHGTGPISVEDSGFCLLSERSKPSGLEARTDRGSPSTTPIAVHLTGEGRRDVLAVAADFEDSEYGRHFGDMLHDLRGWTQRVTVPGMGEGLTLNPGERSRLRLGFKSRRIGDCQLSIDLKVCQTGAIIRYKIEFEHSRSDNAGMYLYENERPTRSRR